MPTKKGTKKHKRYPWTDWFQRKKLKLNRGTHYECASHTMAQQIRNKAVALKTKVSIQVSEESLSVTIHPQ